MKSPRKLAILKPRNRQTLTALVVVVLVAVAGVLFLVISHAATNSVSIEPEVATISSPAATVNDAAASGGKYVRFGAATGGTTATIAAAGDIAGQAPNQDGATANLINGRIGSLDWVLPLGDIQYPSGGNYSGFNSTWGVFKSKMKPTPGNHDYLTASGAGYYNYFGGIAPYYSYNVGAWHMISLNSQEAVNSGSAQDTWLKADLAAHPSPCTLAYMHYPRFSSPGTTKHGDQTQLAVLWQDLYAAGADVVLSGHDHDFEAFRPSKPDGTSDPASGIASFVVGTGGAALDPVTTSAGSSAAGSLGGTSSFGVLFMTLNASSYSWHFDGTDGVAIKSGTGNCH